MCHAEHMPRRYATQLTGVMLACLGVIGMLGPFGTDVYTPAFPVMTRDFDVTPAHIQGTLSLFTIGMALGQFFLGALSDRVGRRPVLLSGGLVMALASLAAACVSDVSVLIVLCLFMGLSAAAGIVGGRALVADLTHGAQAIRPFSLLGMVVSLGPIIGPVAGTALLALGGWRAIFVGLSVYAVAATVLVAVVVPESLNVDARHRGGLGEMLRTIGRIVRDRQYIAFACLIWFGFGMMFAYISSSTFVVQEVLGLPPAAFAVSFSINGVGVIATSFLTSRLSQRVRARALIGIGVIFQIVAFLTLWLIIASGAFSGWFYFPACFLITSSMGFIFGPATAMALEHVRFASGTALALLGSVQFLFAALASFLVGIVNPNPLIALAEVGSAGAGLVLVALVIGRPRAVTSP